MASVSKQLAVACDNKRRSISMFNDGDQSRLLSESQNTESPRSLREGEQDVIDRNQEEMVKEPEEGDKVKTKLITMWYVVLLLNCDFIWLL